MEPTPTIPGERRARRPTYSALTSERLSDFGVAPMRHWREALTHYLHAKGLVTGDELSGPKKQTDAQLAKTTDS
jgi:hypothetical protein